MSWSHSRNCQERRLTHSKAWTDREQWKSQWRDWRRIGRVSTGRTNRWRWSPCRLLVDRRWLHLSSSQWTSSSTPRAEGRNIPYSTKIHWCRKVYSYWSGCVTREKDWRLLECRFKQTFVRFFERIHKIHSIERETSKKIRVVRGGDWQRSKRQLPDQIMYGQKFGRKLVKPLRIEKNRNGQKRNRSSTMLEDWEEFIYWSRRQRILRNSQRCEGKIGKTHGLPRCRVKDIQASWKRVQSRRLAMKMSSKQCMIVLWNLMNLRDNEQNLCSLKTMRITLQVKGFTSDDTLQFGAQVYSDATSDENSGCKSCRGQGMEEARDKSSMGFGERDKSQKDSPFCHTEET